MLTIRNGAVKLATLVLFGTVARSWIDSADIRLRLGCLLMAQADRQLLVECKRYAGRSYTVNREDLSIDKRRFVSRRPLPCRRLWPASVIGSLGKGRGTRPGDADGYHPM